MSWQQYGGIYDMIVGLMHGLTSDGMRAHVIAQKLDRTFVLTNRNEILTARADKEHIQAVASALIARPCPVLEEPFCQPELHVWANLDPDDRAYWLDTVGYIIAKHEELKP